MEEQQPIAKERRPTKCYLVEATPYKSWLKVKVRKDLGAVLELGLLQDDTVTVDGSGNKLFIVQITK